MSAILHSTEGAEERFERAIQWLRDNYQDHNIASLCDGLLIAYGYSSPSGWQPIESAPKDGSEFLAVYGRQGNVMQLIRWNALHGFWQSKGEPEIGFTSNATGWMPLPLPPAPNQGEAS